MSSVWVFQQLGGLHKRLELKDHAAPHGRPRQGAVVDTEDIYRDAETYYAGNSRPTRHVFGSKLAPMILKGRLRDAWGGRGFALKKRDEIRRFCQAQQAVRVTWDDTVGVLGFFRRVKFGIEAQSEIPYELELAIEEDLFHKEVKRSPKEILSPRNLTLSIQKHLLQLRDIPRVPPTMKGDVFDVLEALVGVVGAVTDEVLQVAAGIDSFVNAPFHTLARFRGALGQLKTAVIDLRLTYERYGVTMALETESADEALAYSDTKARMTTELLGALRDIDHAERAAIRAEQGSILLFYAAKDGDTWESISLSCYGSAARYHAIQRSNSVESGQKPVPGTVYMIPR